MNRLLISTIASFAWFTTLIAQNQQQPSGYHSVTCVKVRDGKMADYRQFLDENSHKLGQVLADSGRMSAGYRFRSIMPAGAAATCDYVFVSVFAGAPLPPNAPGALADTLKKAGISMSAAEYSARQSSLATLISTELWRTATAIGDIRKGDYVYINHMKVHDMPAWLEMERSIWKPIAESWVNEGSQRGWMVALPVLPGGTGLKYQAITADVYPSWDAVFMQRSVEKTFKQVHSDKDINQVFEKLGKARDLDLRELMVVEDKIVPGKPSATGGE